MKETSISDSEEPSLDLWDEPMELLNTEWPLLGQRHT